MRKEEALKIWLPVIKMGVETMPECEEALDMAIKALEQEPCEMTAEEYRQRMIQAFHNANTDELIALCVLPTEKEFENLEWLLKNHYKQEPKTEAVKTAIIQELKDHFIEPEDAGLTIKGEYWLAREVLAIIEETEPKTGHWIKIDAKDD